MAVFVYEEEKGKGVERSIYELHSSLADGVRIVEKKTNKFCREMELYLNKVIKDLDGSFSITLNLVPEIHLRTTGGNNAS